MIYNTPAKGEDGLYFVKVLSDEKRKCLIQLNGVKAVDVSGDVVLDLVSEANTQKILEHLEERLEAQPDVILISAYLMYFDLCTDICRVAGERGIPVMIGGAYFNQPSVAESWLGIPGLAALVGGEAEPIVVGLVESLLAKDTLRPQPGVWIPGAESPPLALPPPPSPPSARATAISPSRAQTTVTS